MPTESWVGSETFIDGQYAGSSWDLVKLGEVFLPGVATVEDFEYGQDIDIQKRRKKEKPRIRDNGLAPCAFTIKLELRGDQWIEWQNVLSQIQPRREGAVRSPLAVEHPLPNAYGVRAVYIHKIKTDPPSARKGMVVSIRVAEWFEEEKDTNGAKGKVKPVYSKQRMEEIAQSNPNLVKYSTPNYFGDPRKLAQNLENNRGLPTEDLDDALHRMMDPPGTDAD